MTAERYIEIEAEAERLLELDREERKPEDPPWETPRYDRWVKEMNRFELADWVELTAHKYKQPDIMRRRHYSHDPACD